MQPRPMIRWLVLHANDKRRSDADNRDVHLQRVQPMQPRLVEQRLSCAVCSRKNCSAAGISPGLLQTKSGCIQALDCKAEICLTEVSLTGGRGGGSP